MPTPDDARHALLARLIDHAPLFPPASLPLFAALAEDARAAASAHAWILGRFVCPTSRLQGLPALGRGVSAVLDEPISSPVEAEAVEGRYCDDLAELAASAGEVFVEVPLDDALEERLDAIAAERLWVKIRCGGATVPSVEEFAAFLRACRSRGLRFKATAGLHHAVRAGGEHGLLNLLAAVVFGDEEHALRDEDPEAFGLDSDAFTWRGLAASSPQLASAREERLRSIGSCSFFEPVEELEALGMLA